MRTPFFCLRPWVRATAAPARLFRASSVFSTTARQASRAHKPNKRNDVERNSSRFVPKLSTDELEHFYSQQLFLFRCDVTMFKVTEAMEAYPKLRDLGILKSTDISNLVRQLHDKFRISREKSAILPHCLTIMQDIEEKKVPPHPLAAMHMISCLKEMQEFDIATQHWNWISQQDEDAADARAFGAAIEMFSLAGAPLSYLEELFQEARRRYSLESFIFSANASQLIDVVLLQGIISARVQHGDWRGAYKAFDSCLLMYPDRTPTRVYEIFIYGRPISESILVFLMACRAGTPPRAVLLTTLLKEVLAQTQDIKTMLRLTYSHAGSGGKVQFQALSPLLNGLLSALPQLSQSRSPRDMAECLPSVWLLCQKVLDAYAQIGVTPRVGTFNSIITMGGKLRLPELVLLGLRELRERNLSPIPETFVALMNAFGNLRNSEQVVQSWKGLCEYKSGANITEWSFMELKSMVWAGTVSGNSEFVSSELIRLKSSLSPTLLSKLQELQKDIFDKEVNSSALTPTLVTSSLPAIRNASRMEGDVPADNVTVLAMPYLIRASSLDDVQHEVEILCETLRSSSLQDFSSTTFAFIDSIYSRSPPINMDEQQENHPEFKKLFEAIYKTKFAHQETDLKTSTYIALKELRYLNWKSVNRLMFEAELFETASANKAEGITEDTWKKRFIMSSLSANERARRIRDFDINLASARANSLAEGIFEGVDNWKDESDSRVQLAVMGDARLPASVLRTV